MFFRFVSLPRPTLVLPGPLSSWSLFFRTRNEGRSQGLASSLPRCLAPRSLQVGEAARGASKIVIGKFPNSNQALPQNPKCNRTERGRGEKRGEKAHVRTHKKSRGACTFLFCLVGQTRLGGEIFILFIYFLFISFSCFPFISLSISLVSCLFLSFFSFLSHVPPPARPGPAPVCLFFFHYPQFGGGSLAPRMCICPVSRDKWHPLIGPQHHL